MKKYEIALLIGFLIMMIYFIITATVIGAKAENITQLEIFTEKVEANQQRSVTNEISIDILSQTANTLQDQIKAVMEVEDLLTKEYITLEEQTKANKTTMILILNKQDRIYAVLDALLKELYNDYEVELKESLY